MLYPDKKLFSDALLIDELAIPSRFTGSASSAMACKITGQDSSSEDCNFDITRGDSIPSRNGFHCKKFAQKMR